MIGLVWARAANGVIGAGNTIPWRLPEDQARFRELTMGGTVLMGRRTWDSLPERFRPLPGRRNLVLTRDRSWTADGAEVGHDLADALHTESAVWVIGGAEIYTAALPWADVVEVTELAEPFAGDSFAPELSEEWTPDPAGTGWMTSGTGLRYRYLTYRRVG